MQQTKCFQRWKGQTVYRSVYPTFGKFSGQTIAYLRGEVIRLFIDERGRNSVEVKWEVDINERTGKIKSESWTSIYFDWGVRSLYELEILQKGGLLSSIEPQGCFSESQCESLVKDLPLIRLVLSNPFKSITLNLEE